MMISLCCGVWIVRVGGRASMRDMMQVSVVFLQVAEMV